VVDLSCVFGGAEIRVPPEWDVRNNVVAVFGGVSDQRSGTRPAASGPALVIEGLAMFGGVEIKG